MGQGSIPSIWTPTSSVSLYPMAFHLAEPLASYSMALYKYLSSSLLELNHCPVYSENNEISVIMFIYLAKYYINNTLVNKEI